jgi:hypothetical protein
MSSLMVLTQQSGRDLSAGHAAFPGIHILTAKTPRTTVNPTRRCRAVPAEAVGLEAKGVGLQKKTAFPAKNCQKPEITVPLSVNAAAGASRLIDRSIANMRPTLFVLVPAARKDSPGRSQDSIQLDVLGKRIGKIIAPRLPRSLVRAARTALRSPIRRLGAA